MTKPLCNAQPVGIYTPKELIELEHKYRLLLKKSGFQDIEKWDNQPRKKEKKIRFIKGHMRICSIKKVSDFYHDIILKWNSSFSYFRVIGLYANHCTTIPAKYKDILIDYATTGNLSLSIRNCGNKQKHVSVLWYLKKNLNKMIEYVEKEFNDE